MTTRVGEITKNGVEVPVSVERGQFVATVGDKTLRADTWADLEKQIDRATKRLVQDVAVSFTAVEETRNWKTDNLVIRVLHGTATGLHSANGNVLVRWENGDKQQLSGWKEHGDKFVPLTPDEVQEYRALLQAARTADLAVTQWVDAHKIDLKKSVQDELNRLAKAASEE